MQVLEVLLALPESLLALFLTSWLKVQDVGRIDSAICNKLHRPEFLRQAYHSGLAYSTAHFMDASRFYDRPYMRCSLMRWALARGAAICTIRVNHVFLTLAKKKRVEYLHQNGSHVRRVLFDDKVDSFDMKAILKDLLKFCPNVVDFSCMHTLSVSDYTAIATKWPKLESIKMCDDCNVNSFRVIGQHCKNLRHFDGGYNVESNLVDGWTDLLTQIGTSLETVRGEPFYQPLDACLIYVVARCCPNLRFYDVHGDYVSPASLRTLMQGCPLLTALHTHGTDMSDEGLHVITELGARLTSLDLSDSAIFSDDAMVAMLHTCRNLRTLDLYRSDVFTVATFTAIGACCPLLEELELTEQTKLSDTGICAIARGCPNLRLVGFGHTYISNKGLATLLRSCPRLHSIGLDNCPNIDERGFLSIPRLRPEITDLSILGADISLKGLRALGKGLKKLRYIDVSYGLIWEEQGVFGPAVLVNRL